MSLANWKAQLQAELERLDSSGGSKRAERVIESFTPMKSRNRFFKISVYFKRT